MAQGDETRARFIDRVVLITGAARGQGAVEARRFLAEGASVVLGDVLTDELAALTADLGATFGSERVLSLSLDVSEQAHWAAAVAAVDDRFGGLHVLVHNAGITGASWGSPLRIEDTPDEAWDTVMGVNLRGVFLGTRAAIPMLRATSKRERAHDPGYTGAIVNVSSAQAIKPSGGQAPYATSKWAVRGFTKVAALELAPLVRVNSVHPGPIDTPMIHTGGGVGPEILARLMDDTPMGRVGTSDDVANLVLFLASAESSFCTGSEFLVEGGRTAGLAVPYPDGV
jgi:3alpha(or 20beta)-hydroxysteroid dehydrogenase